MKIHWDSVIGDKTFLVDPRWDEDWAQDDVVTAEIPLAAVTPLSSVVRGEHSLTTVHVEFDGL